jgi:hypothetical protein
VLQQTMTNLCKDPVQSFAIINTGSAPCFIRLEAGGMKPTAWWTTPTKIFTDVQGQINCNACEPSQAILYGLRVRNQTAARAICHRSTTLSFLL